MLKTCNACKYPDQNHRGVKKLPKGKHAGEFCKFCEPLQYNRNDWVCTKCCSCPEDLKNLRIFDRGPQIN